MADTSSDKNGAKLRSRDQLSRVGLVRVEPAKFWGTAALILLLALVGSGAYIQWALRHMHFEFSTTATNRLTGNCLAQVDNSGLGYRESEAEMSYIARMLDLYRTKIGTVPAQLADLNKLPEFERANALNERQFEKDCSIYADQSTSYVIVCGPSKPSHSDVEEFMRTAPFAQKFYKLGQSEILYFPAPRC